MEEADKPGIIATLLARIDASPGFAGLGQSVQLVSKLTEAEEGGTRELTTAILRDPGLTTKLLRLANCSRNGRNVSTIDQAIALLGLKTVKSVVLSLALLNNLSHKPQSNQLHAEIVAAYFCGTLSSEITRIYAQRFSAQEAQVCGLMQNLGRMMALYHLYENIEQVRATQAQQNLTEEDAMMMVLRVRFEEMSCAIAKHWSLPDVLLQSLAPRLEKAQPREVHTAIEWQHLCALFSRRVTDSMFRLPEAQEKVAVTQEIEYFRSALKLKVDEVHAVIEKSLAVTSTLLTDMAFPCNVEQARALLRKGSERVRDMLSEGDALTLAKPGEKTAVVVIQQVLRLIHDKYAFDHTLLCLPDPAGLNAIAGVGGNANQIVTRFRCRGQRPDIFRVIAEKKADLFISNTHAPSLAPLIPEWYRESVNAGAFLLLCLVHEGRLFGMVYGDYASAPSAAPEEVAHGEMAEWRKQLIAALVSAKAKPTAN